MGCCLVLLQQGSQVKLQLSKIRSLIKEQMGARPVTAQEVLTVWEDLFMNSMRNKRKGDIKGLTPGKVTLPELASWLQTTEYAVRDVLHKAGLIVDKEGNVVERGLSTPPSR